MRRFRIFVPQGSRRALHIPGRPTLNREFIKVWFELHFYPLFPTSQERWFADNAKEKACRNVLVITAPRGFRKTTTAKRVCCRNFSPLFKFEYVDSQSYDAFVKPDEKNRFFVQMKMALRQLLAPILLVALFTVPYSLCKAFQKATEVKSDVHALDLATGREVPAPLELLWSNVKKEFPTTTYIVLALLGVLVNGARARRRRVVIFDDITRTPASYNVHPRDFIRDNVLKRISGYETNMNVVIVTSNEGLEWVFSDKNNSVRTILTLPPLEVCEFVDALSRSQEITTTAETIDKVVSKYGEGHGLSMRFWKIECQGKTVAQLLLTAHNPSLSLERPALWEVAIRLDLECEPHYALITLGKSPMVLLSRYKEVLGDDAVTKAEELLDSKEAPRRLVLISLLVATITTGEEKEVRRLLVADSSNAAGETDRF